jgi:galactoside O-acetyltransferase
MGFLNDRDLDRIGLASYGRNVKISAKASFYRPDLIRLGNNVRIDDFVVISPSVSPFEIGNFVHIAAHCMLVGRSTIKMADFSGLSGRVSVYSSSDDYSGEFMTNPTVPSHLTRVESAPVSIGRHVVIGAGAVLLPGVEIGDGSAIAAMSLVNRSLGDGVIAGGMPCRVIKKRSDALFQLEKKINDQDF